MNRRGFLLGLGAGAGALVLPRSPTSYFFAPRAGWLHEAPFGSFAGQMYYPTQRILVTEQYDAQENGVWEVISVDPNNSSMLVRRSLSPALVGESPGYRVTSVL